MIQFIKENNNIKAKLIKKLKKKTCRTVKKIIIKKDTDEENKLSDNNNLKNPTFTLKDLKGKLKFTKFTVSTQSFLCIQI